MVIPDNKSFESDEILAQMFDLKVAIVEQKNLIFSAL